MDNRECVCGHGPTRHSLEDRLWRDDCGLVGCRVAGCPCYKYKERSAVDIVMAHALVQGRYSEEAERAGQSIEAAQYWQAYRALKLAAEDLRTYRLAVE